MSEILCASPLIRGSEFILNDSGQRLFGTCGQRALASVASSVLGSDVSTLGIYDSMRNHGWCDASGATPIGGLVNQASQMSLPAAAIQPYGEPWNSWLPWLEAQINAGNPVVLEVAAGQQLVDATTNAHENAQNLQYHFIAILGRLTGANSRGLLPGWWVADGCSFAGNNDNDHGFVSARWRFSTSRSRCSFTESR